MSCLFLQLSSNNYLVNIRAKMMYTRFDMGFNRLIVRKYGLNTPSPALGPK